MKEAFRRKKNIQFGIEGRAVVSDNVFENIYLPVEKEGEINISKILSLGAENNYEAAKKFVMCEKIL